MRDPGYRIEFGCCACGEYGYFPMYAYDTVSKVWLRYARHGWKRRKRAWARKHARQLYEYFCASCVSEGKHKEPCPEGYYQGYKP